jgi:signal transduction histidine kinase
MIWYPHPYTVILFGCSLATLWVTAFVWRQRVILGWAPATALAGIAIWSLGYAVALGVYDLPGRLFWAKTQHLGIALSAIGMSVFVINYSGHGAWLTRRHLALVAAVPALGAALAWTNEAHHLIWADYTLNVRYDIALLDLTYGAYFWFYAAFNSLILISSVLVFLASAVRSVYLRQRQALIMLGGVLFPTLLMLLSLAHITPIPDLDLMPLGWSICGLVIGWGVFRYGLLDLLPTARNKVIENLREGLIILDAQTRVLDVNPALSRIVRRSPNQIIGKPIAQALPEPFAAIARGNPRPDQPIVVGAGEDCRYWNWRFDLLTDSSNQPNGRVIVVYDMTAQIHARQAIQHATVLEERKRLASELHDSVTQSLYSLMLIAEAGRAAADAGNLELVRQHLRDLSQVSLNTLKEMRLLLYELRPHELEQDGLVGALRQRQGCSVLTA